MNDLLLRLRVETLQSNFDNTIRHMREKSTQLSYISDLKSKVEKAVEEITDVRVGLVEAQSNPKTSIQIRWTDTPCAR